ncbi:MAG: HD domain-containing protein [Erysipelotrichaceae bacterium]|nr:HD domain-containing protein [Erysipelotrichaceae bacterium]
MSTKPYRKTIHLSQIGGWIALIFFGIALNLAGIQIANSLDMNLYLDSIGTIASSAIGGYLPGVLVGFFTNTLSSLIYDQINIYYAVLNVLIAVIATALYNKGFLGNIWKAAITAILIALTNGIIGGTITYLINNYLGTLEYLPFLSGEIKTELIDKAVTILLVFIFIKLEKKYVKEDLQFHTWRQRPLSIEEKQHADSSYSHTHGQASLRNKLLMAIIIVTTAIAFVMAGISYMQYRNETISNNMRVGTGTAKMAASCIDGDMVDEYIEKGEEAYRYLEIKTQLAAIKESSNDIEYVYVYRILPDGCHVVFDIDTAEVEGSKPGEIIEFDPSFTPYLDELLAGKQIEPIVSDDKFGWLLTVYEPVKDSNGVTQCYACVDISMARVQTNQIAFLTKVISLFLGFFITIIIFALWLAEYNILLPINTMAIAARDFTVQSTEGREESVENFKNLQISTNDEIENLYDSFSMTIEETISYLVETQKQAAALNKMQNGLIMVLADMVESRDQCTGDHVRKTAAYCRIILEQLKKDGLYTDQLTSSFIDDVVNSAPLHDIGKIKVPDSILNKPGKLTDEEFEIMKTHTSAGNEIIQQAMELVSTDSGYLKEAKNLATYHHEKYNGKGYPVGLSGEDIPLSARVMAVADVFDALVSRRSYKEPFSFEKAMQIIEEGSGSHFDPNIVKAFFEAKDKVKEVSEKFIN